jgi:hypothetical protein
MINSDKNYFVSNFQAIDSQNLFNIFKLNLP